MANSETISRSDHLKAMVKSEELLEHLTTDHEAKSVPVSRAGQAKLHAELHPAVAAETEPTEPTPAAEPTEDPIAGPKTELDTLRDELAAMRTAPAPKAAKPDFGWAKNELFRAAVIALDEMVGGLKDEDPILGAMNRAEAARLISQAIHHFATGKDQSGARRWPATTLPKPNRSDWR